MKKDRNSFFSGYGFNTAQPGMQPGMMPGMQPGMMPPEQVAANSNFYAGPAGKGHGMPGAGISPDIDSRLSKIERQVNRLEMRVNKIEGDTGGIHTPYNDNDYNYSNSMYMV